MDDHLFLGLLYNSQFLSTTIRKIPLLKGLYVGIVWGLVNGWLSFHYFSFSIFLMTLLFITALILPFDIRDVDTDSIVTFPQLIGIKKTKYLAYGMLISAAGLSIIYLKEQYAIAFVLTCFISMIFVFFTEKIIQTSTFRLV
jgi:4-hydroxybenzoate polyprenyltransferase